MQTTITEALSEINLIKKKIEKKQQDVIGNLVRWEHLKDPFESEGGASKYLRSEIQSIEDLRKKWVKIRSAIAKANTDNTITIGNTTKSINEWLNWKREVAQEESKFAVNVHVRIKNAMDESVQKPQVIKDDSGQIKICKLLANLEYPEFLKKSQEVDEILETLDGKLSLKNATIMIEI